MAIWYRVAKKENVNEVFSGDGGLFVPGRWNHQGNKVIYCSESIALCTLEWLSHNGLSVSGFDYHRFSIVVPDDLIKRYTSNDLFDQWDATPSTNLNRDFAEEALFKQDRYLGLALPSVLINEEYNLIINPLHKDFKNVFMSVKYLGKYAAPVR